MSSSLYAEHVPGYAETQAKLDALRKLPRPAARGNDAVGIAATDLIAGLGEGEVDQFAIAAAAAAEVAAVQIAIHARTEAHDVLSKRLADLVASNHDAILTALHGQLEDVVAGIRAHGDLSQVRTTEAAVEHDRVEDHRTLRGLLAQHQQIRAQQMRIAKTTTTLTEVLFTPNLPDVFGLWAPWHSPGYLVQPSAGNGERTATRRIDPPWPHDGDARPPAGSELIAVFSSTEWLLWALSAGVRLWVPTTEQTETTTREHTRRLEPEHRQLEHGGGWRDQGAVSRQSPERVVGREPGATETSPTTASTSPRSAHQAAVDQLVGR